MVWPGWDSWDRFGQVRLGSDFQVPGLAGNIKDTSPCPTVILPRLPVDIEQMLVAWNGHNVLQGRARPKGKGYLSKRNHRLTGIYRQMPAVECFWILGDFFSIGSQCRLKSLMMADLILPAIATRTGEHRKMYLSPNYPWKRNFGWGLVKRANSITQYILGHSRVLQRWNWLLTTIPARILLGRQFARSINNKSLQSKGQPHSLKFKTIHELLHFSFSNSTSTLRHLSHVCISLGLGRVYNK